MYIFDLQYLELRFNRATRKLQTFLFVLTLFFMLPIFIFMPSLAFAQGESGYYHTHLIKDNGITSSP